MGGIQNEEDSASIRGATVAQGAQGEEAIVESPRFGHNTSLSTLLGRIPKSLLSVILLQIPGVDGRPTHNPLAHGTLGAVNPSAHSGCLFGFLLAVILGNQLKDMIDASLRMARSKRRVGGMVLLFTLLLGLLLSFALADPDIRLPYALLYIIGTLLIGLLGIIHLVYATTPAFTCRRNAVPAEEAVRNFTSLATLDEEDGCDCNGQGCSKCGGGGSGGSSVKKETQSDIVPRIRTYPGQAHSITLDDDGCDCNGQGCSKCGSGGSGGSSVKN